MKWLTDILTTAASKLFTGWFGVAAFLGGVVLYLLLVVLPDQAEQRGQQTGQLTYVAAGASAAAAHTASQAASGVAIANLQIQQATSDGLMHERVRTRIQIIYRTLDKEAIHASNPPELAACVLPADRLRIWQSANLGPTDAGDSEGQGGTAGQSAAPAASSSAASDRAAGRPGVEPSGRGASLPSTGSANVRAAQTSGDRAP